MKGCRKGVAGNPPREGAEETPGRARASWPAGGVSPGPPPVGKVQKRPLEGAGWPDLLEGGGYHRDPITHTGKVQKEPHEGAERRGRMSQKHPPMEEGAEETSGRSRVSGEGGDRDTPNSPS